jgi:hypothetical protein
MDGMRARNAELELSNNQEIINLRMVNQKPLWLYCNEQCKINGNFSKCA